VVAGIAAAFVLTSPAFHAGGMIPRLYTCDGRNISPPLRWSAPPRGTRSLALLVVDPDAPSGTFTHWIAYDLAPAKRSLPANARPAFEGVNDAGRIGYTGPCPPSGTHRYVFRLYALATSLQLKIKPQRQILQSLLRGKTLAVATLVGRYGRH
jgi:Raf kinase inhibitor-like YbhB/YbcL family protein